MRSATSPAGLLFGALLTPHASPHRRHLGTDHPGISPPNFATATVSNSNLGGLCGLSCKTDQSNYDTATGACAYTDTSDPKCDRGAAHEMYFQGLGSTQSGNQVDLRVTNLTEYTPWDSNQNGLSGAWGQISILANHPSEFLFEFVDTVHARCYPFSAHLPPQCPLYCPLSVHLPPQCLLYCPLSVPPQCPLLSSQCPPTASPALLPPQCRMGPASGPPRPPINLA